MMGDIEMKTSWKMTETLESRMRKQVRSAFPGTLVVDTEMNRRSIRIAVIGTADTEEISSFVGSLFFAGTFAHIQVTKLEN